MTSFSTITRWSTDAVPRAQRHEYYQDMLASAVTPMWISTAAPGSFEAEVTMTDLGPLSVLRMRGTAHVAHRGKRELERSLDRTFHLVLDATVPMLWTHRGRVRVAPGDAILVDSNSGIELDIGSPYDCIHLRLSERWLRQWVPAPQVLVGRMIAAKSGWGRALTAFFTRLSPRTVAALPIPGRVVVDQVGALLALVADEMSGAAGTIQRVDPALQERIHDVIRQRCGEMSLTAHDAALAVNISARTLHRALQRAGTTFGAVLLAARADLAMRMLQSPMHRRLTIGEIGRRAGFADASHFGRVLRSRSGMTPSQIRRGAACRAEEQDH